MNEIIPYNEILLSIAYYGLFCLAVFSVVNLIVVLVVKILNYIEDRLNKRKHDKTTNPQNP